VAPICRACRNPGSVDTCKNGNVCQRNAATAPTCGPKKNNGDASGCISDAICKSGYCVGMDTGLDVLGFDMSIKYCRECPTAGSSTGCPSEEFCQRLDGDDIHVCRPKKGNGKTCLSDTTCKSGNCVPDDVGALKYCRVCTNNDHCENQYGSSYKCYDNLATFWIKKCCKRSCTYIWPFGDACTLNSCKS